MSYGGSRSIVSLALLFALAAIRCSSETDLKYVAPDVIADTTADTETYPVSGLPQSLELEYSRADEGAPLSDDEVRAFTRRVMSFLQDVNYFDYVLYTTHGVDASTEMRDWQFWYEESFRKEGDLVTFVHSDTPTRGGPNLHIPMSRVLGNVLSAYMLVGAVV